MVETELSFVNQLVSFLTLNIYTPMHIKVTCAAAGGTADASVDNASGHRVDLSKNASTAEVVGAFSVAAEEAVASGNPVYVHFE